MAFNFFNPQKEVGPTDAIKQWSQLSNLTLPQQAVQAAMLGKGLLGMINPGGSSFEPIRQEALRSYRENVLPGILNQVGDRPNSSAYGQALGRGQEDLAVRLAALRGDWQNMQNQRYDQITQNLLNQGMKPSFENLYAPVPLDAARQYLEQQGNKNPSQQQIQEVMQHFQPPQTLGQLTQQLASGQGKDIAQQALNAYKTGGIKGITNLIQKKTTVGTPLVNAPQGTPQTVPELLAQQPQIAQALQQNTQNATPEQKSAADWILANKRAHMPLLTQKLQPQDYQLLQSLMQDPDPRKQSLAYSLSNRKELEQLLKIIASGNQRKLTAFLKRYGTGE